MLETSLAPHHVFRTALPHGDRPSHPDLRFLEGPGRGEDLRGVSPEDLLELRIISQQVAGELGLEVRLGEPGGGSYYCFRPPSITLDPLQVARNPSRAKFVAGHEGAHGRFSVSPELILSDTAEVEEVFGKLGMHSTNNVLEDCAINDGMVREFPGMRKHTTGYYGEALGGPLSIATPEVIELCRMVGREPKFARALAEMTRDWHSWRAEKGYDDPLADIAKEGRYRAGLDPSVLLALRRTRRAVREVISAMPAPRESDPRILHDLASKRLDIVRREVFPEMERLVREDVSTEALRQALMDKQPGKSGKSALEEKLSPQAARELSRAMQELRREEAEQMAKELEALEEELERAKEEAETGSAGSTGSPQASSPKPGSPKGSSAKPGSKAVSDPADSNGADNAGAKESGSPMDDTSSASSSSSGGRGPAAKPSSGTGTPSAKERGIEGEMRDRFPGIEPGEVQTHEELVQAMLEKIADAQAKSGEIPLPYDRLSPVTQRELAKKYEELPAARRAELETKAKEVLDLFEHEIVKATRSKLDENPLETEVERRERLLAEEERREEIQGRLDDLVAAERKLEEQRVAALDPFDRAFEKVSGAVIDATNRLQRVLIPESFFRWERDRQAGSRLNLGRARDAEADPRYLTRLFEERLNPVRRTHAFVILVDTSDSMKGQKMTKTFEGAVFVGSLAENLGVDTEIIEFNDNHTVRKSWKDKLSDEAVRDEVGQSSTAKSAGTMDAPAINAAYRHIRDKDAKYKFVFVLTDAESGASAELKKVLKKIEKGETVVVVHFGIGSGTSDSCGYYRHSYGDLDPEAFFVKFCEVVEDIITNPEKYLKRPGK